MTLTHRERFILHSSAILSAQAGTSKEMGKEIIDMIINNRCRDLKDRKEVDTLLDDIEEEIRLSSVLYKGDLL